MTLKKQKNKTHFEIGFVKKKKKKITWPSAASRNSITPRSSWLEIIKKQKRILLYDQDKNTSRKIERSIMYYLLASFVVWNFIFFLFALWVIFKIQSNPLWNGIKKRKKCLFCLLLLKRMKFTTFSSFAKIDSLNHTRIRAKSFYCFCLLFFYLCVREDEER